MSSDANASDSSAVVQKDVNSTYPDLRSEQLPWFKTELPNPLAPSIIRVFETWSGIPTDQLEQHVLRCRNKAWVIHPYPCIGQWRFLETTIANAAEYPAILDLLKSNPDAKFLDLGCCFGQELRCLAADGVASTQLYGSDLRPDFWELGFELFQDRDKLQSTFIAADIFDPDSNLKALDGQVDVIFAGSFLHLFNMRDQLAACERIVRLLKPNKGSLLLGRQMGQNEPGVEVSKSDPNKTFYRHNLQTFKDMWGEVGKNTGTKWDVETSQYGNRATWAPWESDQLKYRLQFSVRRVD